ncbi:helix-turn-helix domain-containing protein [Gloeothece verrucosa]|uniref:Transcriptional regulator, XRE family n=1 Tax=Gloeothece verrucosa (strain PCC 7822) TaxID=497965 RepID=E0UAH8_GLOV7|nr:helix-turn-helix transcriptional regulator [Gloeothece verrucosa]ADN12719.1 transcriptional regulator, XRE family [Gloeothece verrucosa PCC 7822]
MNFVKVRRYIDKEVQGLGDRIRKARKESGETIEVLAGKAGISRVYWYDIENERIRDSLPEETLRKIEKALNLDLGVNFDD